MPDNATNASDAVRLAMFGAGGIARTHAKAAAKIADRVRVVAAVDPSPDAAAAFREITDVPFFDTADALLAAVRAGEVELDALFVCTPPAVRAAVVGPALEAGLHVLIEKPLARTAEEAAGLIEVGDAHADRVAAVAYCHRFTPAMVAMKRLVGEGKIGRLTRFENVFAFHHPGMAATWFSDPSVSGGGSFVDTGCHSLDLFQFLVGPPEPVGAVADYDWEARGDSSATALVRAASGEHEGVGGVILSGWMESPRFQVRLVGTEGSLAYDFEHATTLTHTDSGGTASVIDVEDHDLRFERQLAAFADAVRSGGSATTAGLATLKEAGIVAESIDKVHSALRLYNNTPVSRLSSPGAGSGTA